MTGPRVFLLTAMMVAAASSPPAAAAPATPVGLSAGITADIRVGFGGYVVPDAWIPVTLRLRSEREVAGTVEVTTSRARPPGTERVRVEVHLVPRTPHPLTVPVIVRDLRSPLVVRFLEQGGVAATWPVSIPAGRLVDGVVLAVSRRPVGLQQILGESGRIRVAYVTADDLPARWQLYEGVAAVVVRDLDDRRLIPAQVEALAGWVATGGRLIIAAPRSEILSRPALQPFIVPPPLPPPFPGAPEEVHPWGRGRVTVIPVDPFRADLPPDDAAMWTRLLGEPRTPPFVDRTLLDVLPQSPGTSLSLQVVILLTLGLYLILLRPLTRGLLRGRSGWALAAALLVGVTAVTATLNLAVRRGASTIVQGVVAVALPDQGVALVESVGRVLLSRRGAFQLRAGAETLVRPLAGAETTLVLNQVVRFEGRAEATLPVRAATLVPLPIHGLYREGPEGVEVQIENRSGRRLRDPIVFLDGRIQPLPPLDHESRATLSPLRWREPAAVDAVRGPENRLLAWAFGRLRGDAILSPTVSLVAWLDDDRGILHWPGQPAAPLLLVLPLSRPEGAP